MTVTGDASFAVATDDAATLDDVRDAIGDTGVGLRSLGPRGTSLEQLLLEELGG